MQPETEKALTDLAGKLAEHAESLGQTGKAAAVYAFEQGVKYQFTFGIVITVGCAIAWLATWVFTRRMAASKNLDDRFAARIIVFAATIIVLLPFSDGVMKIMAPEYCVIQSWLGR